jgi:peptide/nickel transport system substrate-binding protein
VTDGLFLCFLAGVDRVELRLRDLPGKPESIATRGSGGLAGVLASEKTPERARVQPAAEPRAATRQGAIKRIREIRLPAGQSATAALRRGDVSLIEHVPPDQVMGLEGTPGIKVGKYVNPRIHFLALDGRQEALRLRSLRRGLSYAIDRQALLEDYVIKRAAQGADAVADGPFPKGSYADAPGVKPLEAHLWLARMLVAAARKERNNAPIKLNLEYPSIPEVRAIVPRLAEAFRQVGVEITLLELPLAQLEGQLRAGRRFDLAYRCLESRDPVLESGTILCPGYDAPPEADALASSTSPRILQLLLQLERASEWTDARSLAVAIDRETRDELPIIPLWQLADHYAWRDRLNGPGKEAVELYQGVETWEIVPWVAKDPWKSAP